VAGRGGYATPLTLESERMKITFKLFATLTDYLPAQVRHSNVMELDVPGDASISQIIEPFGLPTKLVHLVLVNGTYVQPGDRLSRTLKEGDVLAIWPPIAGG
jgi:molybdopterin converting factor small subunit